MRFMVTQPEENQPHYLRGFAKEGNGDWVDRLLSAGVDANDKDEHGMTALHLASAANHGEIVDSLLSHSASAAAVNRNGQTALHLAAAAGHLAVVERLLRGAGRDVIDLKATTSGHTALHYASRHGHPDVCRLLLRRGAEKSIPDAVRLPPVRFAKNEETRRVFEEAAPVPAQAPKAPATKESPPPAPAQAPKETPLPVPAKAPAATRASRSKSSDPPRGPRAKDPSTERREAAGTDRGRGQLHRNDVDIFSEAIARRDGEVGPVVVDKKAEAEARRVKDKKMTFSDAHKKRMQMSVFDRLAGGSRKK